MRAIGRKGRIWPTTDDDVITEYETEYEPKAKLAEIPKTMREKIKEELEGCERAPKKRKHRDLAVWVKQMRKMILDGELDMPIIKRAWRGSKTIHLNVMNDLHWVCENVCAAHPYEIRTPSAFFHASLYLGAKLLYGMAEACIEDKTVRTKINRHFFNMEVQEQDWMDKDYLAEARYVVYSVLAKLQKSVVDPLYATKTLKALFESIDDGNMQEELLKELDRIPITTIDGKSFRYSKKNRDLVLTVYETVKEERNHKK